MNGRGRNKRRILDKRDCFWRYGNCDKRTKKIHVNRKRRGYVRVEYGSLFALLIKERRERVEYEKNGVPRKYPYCDYDLYPDEDWGHAFIKDADCQIKEMEYTRAFDCQNPPLKIETKMYKIEFGEEDGHRFVVSRYPKSTVCQREEIKNLQPYGATALRMTEMPVLPKIK